MFQVIENDSSDFIPTLLKTVVLPLACSYGNQVCLKLIYGVVVPILKYSSNK